MIEFYVPLTARERIDDWVEKITDFHAGRPEPTVKLNLMVKAAGIVNQSALVIQIMQEDSR